MPYEANKYAKKLSTFQSKKKICKVFKVITILCGKFGGAVDDPKKEKKDRYWQNIVKANEQ